MTQPPPRRTLTSLLQARWRQAWIVFLLCVAASPATAASLLGDYTCSGWAQLQVATKKRWADSFLAPLSLAFKPLQTDNRDAYNEGTCAPDRAVSYVDAYCAGHPEKAAADGAGAFFQQMTGQ